MKCASELSNSPALSNLGQSKIFALLEIPQDKREDFTSQPHEINGQTKTVDEMITRELQKVIKFFNCIYFVYIFSNIKS